MDLECSLVVRSHLEYAKAAEIKPSAFSVVIAAAAEKVVPATKSKRLVFYLYSC